MPQSILLILLTLALAGATAHAMAVETFLRCSLVNPSPLPACAKAPELCDLVFAVDNAAKRIRKLPSTVDALQPSGEVTVRDWSSATIAFTQLGMQDETVREVIATTIDRVTGGLVRGSEFYALDGHRMSSAEFSAFVEARTKKMGPFYGIVRTWSDTGACQVKARKF